jgi:hypothetical protein
MRATASCSAGADGRSCSSLRSSSAAAPSGSPRSATSSTRPPRFVPARGDDEEARTPASVQRAAAVRVVEAWMGLSRDLLVAAAGRAELTPSAELADELGELGRRIGVAPLLAMLEHLERVHAGLGENAAPRLALESAMLRWPMLPAAGDR